MVSRAASVHDAAFVGPLLTFLVLAFLELAMLLATYFVLVVLVGWSLVVRHPVLTYLGVGHDLLREGRVLHATASESDRIMGLLELNESNFPSLVNSRHSCLGLSTSECARVSHVAPAVAPAGVCFRSSFPAWSAAVAHAHASTLHVA